MTTLPPPHLYTSTMSTTFTVKYDVTPLRGTVAMAVSQMNRVSDFKFREIKSAAESLSVSSCRQMMSAFNGVCKTMRVTRLF